MEKVADSELPQYLVLENTVIVRVGKKRCVAIDEQPFLRVTLRDNPITYDPVQKRAYVNENMPLDRGKLQYHRPEDLRDEAIVHLNGESRDCRADNLCYKSQEKQRRIVYTSKNFLTLEKRALDTWAQ